MAKFFRHTYANTSDGEDGLILLPANPSSFGANIPLAKAKMASRFGGSSGALIRMQKRDQFGCLPYINAFGSSQLDDSYFSSSPGYTAITRVRGHLVGDVGLSLKHTISSTCIDALSETVYPIRTLRVRASYAL